MGLLLLNPWMLSALAAAAVPVWLHLRARRSERCIPFPAAAILPEAQTARAARRRRLRELLLLAARIALLVLLALLFAKPGVRRRTESPSGAPLALAIVLDDSPSMAARTSGGSTRLEKARACALRLLNALPEGSPALVALTSGPIEGPTADRPRLRAFVERAAVSFLPTSLPHALRRSARRLEGVAIPDRHAVLVSDFAHGAWPGDVAAPDALALLPVRFADVGDGEADDWLVSGLSVEPGRLWQGLAARVRVRVKRRAGAGAPAAEAPVALRVNDRLVGREHLRLEPGESAEANFALAPRSAGPIALEARIEIEDANALDDARTVVLDVNAPIETLLVAPPGRGRFVRDALAPFPGAERARCRVRSVAPAELGRAPLEEIELVVLVDAQLDSATAERLVRFTDGGGGLLVFLDPAADRDAGAARVLGTSPRRERKGPATLAAGRSALGRACARAFGGALPEGKVQRWRPLAPGARAEVAFTLRGEPAALERPLGRGRVVTFGFAPEPESAPLVADAPTLFVVLIHESAVHLARSSDVPLATRPGEPVALTLEARERGATATIITALGRREIPVDPVQLRTCFPAPESPGIAWVETQRDGKPLRRRALAVNAPVAEFAAGRSRPPGARPVEPNRIESVLAGEVFRERADVLAALFFLFFALETVLAARHVRGPKEAGHG